MAINNNVMNWKQLASMCAAAAVAAVVSVLSKQEPAMQAGFAGIIAAIVHKITVWGDTSKEVQ